MPKNYVIDSVAREDMRGILRYIWRDNPLASKQMSVRFYDAFSTLGDSPYIGQRREELTSLSVHFWPVHPNYMIVYNPSSDPIQILRILHSARDLARILQ